MSRLAKRAWVPKDTLPEVGSVCLMAGANSDISCDQDRTYGKRFVIGYSPCREFGCFQSDGCWPVVERLTNCWFTPNEDEVTSQSLLPSPTGDT